MGTLSWGEGPGSAAEILSYPQESSTGQQRSPVEIAIASHSQTRLRGSGVGHMPQTLHCSKWTQLESIRFFLGFLMVPVCWSPSHTASFPPGVRMPRICAQHQAKFWWWKPTGMVVDLSLEVASQRNTDRGCCFKWFPVAKLHRTCLDWLEGSSPQSQAGASGNSLEGALPAWMRVGTT